MNPGLATIKANPAIGVLLGAVIVLGLLAIWRPAGSSTALRARLRRRNELYAFATACSGAVIHSPTLEQLFENVCRVAVGKGGLSATWIGRVDDERRRIVPVAAVGAPVERLGDRPLDDAEDRGPAALAVLAGQPIVSDAVCRDPAFRTFRAIAAEHGINSAGAFPIARGGRAAYVLTVLADEPGYFGPSERGILEELSAHLAFATERFEHDARQERTRREAALIAGAVQSSPDAILTTSLDGTITSWNAGAERLLGYAAADMIGASVTRILPADAAPVEAADLEAGLPPFDTVHVASDGTPIPVSLRLAAIRDGEGRVLGVSRIARDIRWRLEAQRELRNSELRFRQITESLPQLVWTCRADGICDYLSPQWVAYTGSTELDPLPSAWEQSLHPEDLPSIRRAWEHSVQSGTPLATEFRIRRHDGAYRWFDTRAVPLRDERGRIVRWFGTNTDIHDRRLADERFRLVVEAAPSAMLMVDRQRTIRMVNRKTEDVFGYERDELLGHSLDRLIPPRALAAHTRAVTEYFDSPSARATGSGRDLFGIRRDGTEVPVEVGLTPIETPSGTFTLASVIDITERKRREDELRRSNAELERFAYIASHDLKEPLRAVAGCVQILQRRYQGQLDERADTLIGHAVEGAERMQTLIDGLLAFARVSTHGEEFFPVRAADALATALRNLETAIAETGATITVAHDLPVVRADARQLSIVFQNLLGNALRFRSAAAPRIHVSAAAVPGGWRLSIGDNGIGIAPEHQERIFVIFQRLHTRGEYPGTGLGLALCRRIVERHGGTMGVTSSPGAGATFFFTLPGAGGGAGGRHRPRAESAAGGVDVVR